MMNGHRDAYLEAAIRGEVNRLATACVGERNTTLFKATAALASLGLREGEIIEHLKPAAQEIGLRGKELYSTIKSGVRAGSSKPRGVPRKLVPITDRPGAIAERPASLGLPARSTGDDRDQPPSFFVGGNDGPRVTEDEIRRHVYRRDGKPVRIKLKRRGGFVNWYRVTDGGREGWQARKPEGYVQCPYVVKGLDPFDAELAGEILYWPEGEKDCDTLGRLLQPVFTFGGVGDGLPEGAVEYTRGRQLIILADNDKGGRDHAIRKAELSYGVAAGIKIVEFPELVVGGDVSDFLKSHTIADLEERIDKTPWWSPAPAPGPAAPSGSRILLTCSLSDIAPEKVEWLWPGRIAIGKLAMIAGEPGLGKSQLSIGLAASVTVGGPWPDGVGCSPLGSVIILSAEDGLADTIRPRFDASGGAPSKVKIVRAVQTSEPNGVGRRSFDLAADLSLLEEIIQAQADCRLVLIDPVSSYLGRVDSHKNADVRGVLEPLAEMAERLRVAVVAITHLSKGDGKAINRFIGSIAFVAAARTAFAVVADPDDEARLRRLFLQVKNNIASPQPGLAFRLGQYEVAPGVIGSSVVWDRAPVSMTADEALRRSRKSAEGSAKDDAVEFLRELLASGPMEVLDIEFEARAAAMLSESRRLNESKPFRTAARELGIVRKRQGFGPGASVRWSLPVGGRAG